ncbi:hypothetical protein C2G38_2220385 [Gigaspora rosea]|uniref:Uncharacterized protein n=1 Tax=Gigaspora rosea TaxID=44941 RepID=A0A397U4L6_9GLOM|nr:hypothetical protein C2G38_2220385 [Gigaspora rosea]
MPKYKVSLVFRGEIIKNLHYGPYARAWWVARPTNNYTVYIPLYPLCLGMKTITTINGQDFMITVIQDNLEPRFLCQLEDLRSKICKSSSEAITSVYQLAFSTKTKLDVILEIGISDNPDWNYASKGYKSSFIYNFQKTRSLFLQEFTNNEAVVKIYQNSQETCVFRNVNANIVWNKIGILMHFTGNTLFGLEHEQTKSAIEKEQTSHCTVENWQTKFKEIYPPNYIVKDRELRAWKALLRHTGCTNVTPFGKESKFEFWTRSKDSAKDGAMLKYLYESKFLQNVPVNNENKTDQFWNTFQDALDSNIRGNNRKRRILSIIAERFHYDTIKEKLSVTCRYARINGPGGVQLEKPKITLKKLTPEKEEQIESFFQDKANVIMSSYKTDATGLPVHYLKNNKRALWERFNEKYPDAHQTRKVYLNAQFNAHISELDETGWTLHSTLVYTRPSNNTNLQVRAFDHWLTDMRQDAWFTASSLHAAISEIDPQPEWVIFISDNGPHYHNADLMMIMGRWKEWYNVHVRKWTFLEAGEAKTTIDSHHAQISHALNRHVRLGFNIAQGSDIELAIEGICGTSVANLEPERSKGNSNWFSWEWPWDDNCTGYIRARAMPNIGEWNEFTPAKLEKLQKKDIQKPNPQVSAHSVPKSSCNAVIHFAILEILPDRLTVDQLKIQLTNRKVGYNSEKLSVEALNPNEENEFPLALGWALKENQRKRGGGKRISKHIITYLEGYFLAGNINKSDRYSAEDMHNELIELVKIGSLEESDVPKVSTIQNWIGRYATQYKQKIAHVSQYSMFTSKT